MITDDPTRSLRFYLGAGLVFLAGAPLLMFTLAIVKNSPSFSPWPLLAAPVLVAGIGLAVTGMAVKDPKRSARWLGIAAGLVVLGDVLLFGLRAVLA